MIIHPSLLLLLHPLSPFISFFQFPPFSILIRQRWEVVHIVVTNWDLIIFFFLITAIVLLRLFLYSLCLLHIESNRQPLLQLLVSLDQSIKLTQFKIV